MNLPSITIGNRAWHVEFRTGSGFLYATLAAVLWSLIGPFSKECLGAGVSPLETAFWRALVGGLCFVAQAALSGCLRIPPRDAIIFSLFGGWGIGVLFGALQAAIQLSGAAMAMVLMYTAPAWVAVVSRFWFHEAITRQKRMALFIALAGTALICFSGGSLQNGHSFMGIACGLLSGLAYASHFPFYTYWKKRYSISTIYAFMLLGGAVCLFPFAVFTSDKSWEIWGWLTSLGVLTNYLAYIALALSLQRISQIQAAVIGNIEPLLATLWVWIFFGENFTASGWAGCILIIGSVFLLTIERKPTSQR